LADQFLNLNGARIVAGTIMIPLYGLWAGDVSLAGDQAMPDRVTLTLGNLTMKGAVYRQATFAGTRYVRLVGGMGGWHKTLPRKTYVQLGGLQLSTVLRDAAAEVAEQLNIPSGVDRVIGQRWVREELPGARILRQVYGMNWHVDVAGVTQLAPWPAKTITSPFQVTKQDGGRGIIEVATEDYASWMPGVSFTSTTLTGTYKAGSVSLKFEASGTARLEVMTYG